jgi:bifunctional non-homologous end joining protein LigD
MRGRSLDPYRAKRDSSRTPEPFGVARAAARSRAGASYAFVIQQHAARRMHWDFRLEIDGVLVSWAVPRGPSVDPKEKRLAVQTEDHPLEYGGFEGIIPAGNYGAGAVILWDRGLYRTLDGAAPGEGVARGKLDIELQGEKLGGRWALVRTKRGEGKEWLLFKKADGSPAAPEPVVALPGSVLSGLTVEELRKGVTRDEELAALADAAGAPRRAVRAAALSPMLAETAERAFTRAGWIFELKYDGWRVLVGRDEGGGARIQSRRGRDLGDAFPEVVEAAAHLPCRSFVLDGEIIASAKKETGSFEQLQGRVGQTNPVTVAQLAAEVPVAVQCFDLLAVAGYDLRALPLTARKRILRRLLPARGTFRFADHVEEEGEALFAAAVEHRVEGIVAKRADSPYRAGRRSRDWLKIKAPKTADLAVVGYVPGKGSRRRLGSLMLAWRQGDGFRYAGNAGSGLDEDKIRALLDHFEGRRRDTPEFDFDGVERPRDAVFVEPDLVAQVRYAEVTSAGVLRQPVFERLRDEKEVEDCDARPRGEEPAVRRPEAEEENSEFRIQNPEAAAPLPEANPPTALRAPQSRLRLTNLDKVFWPAEGYTKGDLLAYYEAIWPHLAPYLSDRPLVLTRYPDGIEGKSFFQKNAPEFTPEWVETCRIEDTEFFVCNELETLLYVINTGCIPLHLWSARHATIDRPDWTILDLDPKGAPFSDVVKVARHIHSILEPLGAPHFVKTSGQDGLHILLPLAATLSHDQAKALAEVLARVVAAELPAIATVARPLGDRGGKVYVDFLQNGFGKTIAGPYSVRPRPGAPVSAPLAWREVGARLDPSRFTIRTLPKRAGGRPDPLAAVLGEAIDVAAVLAALEKRLR